MAGKLNEKAMLVTLRIQMWSARKEDKKVSRDVASQYQTTSDVGRYQKALIAKESIEAIRKAQTDARTFHYTNSLPWQHQGAQILTAANFDTYSKEMRKKRHEFEALAKEFCTNYSQYVEDARGRLNGMFKESDYPRTWEIAQKFSFSFSFNPLPAAPDFRVDIAGAEIDQIKIEIEERSKQAEVRAMADIWNRLYETVSKMAATLANDKTPFHNSLIGNIGALCELLPRLNIANDPELDSMTAKISKALVDKHSMHDLKKDKVSRSETAKAAKALAKEIQQQQEKLAATESALAGYTI
jgi:hypothetical protein